MPFNSTSIIFIIFPGPEVRLTTEVGFRNTTAVGSVFMLDREVSTRVPQRDNHGFVQFLLPPPDIGSAQLSVSCHLPGQLGESSAMCEFLHEVPQKRTCSPSTFSYPQKEKPIYVLGNLFAAVLWQKRRQFCSIIFICSPKEETSCPGSWGPFFVPISCKHILVNARSE